MILEQEEKQEKDKQNNDKDNSHTYVSPFTRRKINLKSLILILGQKKECNHGICGNMNLGNTCYMNSALACLSNCLELTTYFLSKEYEKDLNTNRNEGSGGELAKIWYQILNEYWLGQKECVNPNKIKTLLHSKTKKFSGLSQQDSNEFMTLFLETLGEDLNLSHTKEYKVLEEQKEDETDLSCAKKFWESHIKMNNNVITELFHGLFRSEIICPTCNWKSVTYEAFNTLNLPLPHLEKQKTKKDIVKLYTVYYIPKYGLRKTLKVDLKLKVIDYLTEEEIESGKKLTIKDLKKCLLNTKNFPYKPEKIDIMSVANKNFDCYLKDDDLIPNTFLFASESNLLKENYWNNNAINNTTNNNNNSSNITTLNKDLNKSNSLPIPIYLLMDYSNKSLEEKKSSYPRSIYYTNNTNYAEFKKKAYYLVRKFIFDPRLIEKRSRKDIGEVDKSLKDYIKNENSEEKYEERFFNLINQEYEDIMIRKQNKKFSIDLPYRIKLYDENNDGLILFDNDNEIPSEPLASIINISNDNDSINTLISYALNKKLQIIIEIIPKSKYSRSKTNLSTCKQFISFTNNDNKKNENLIKNNKNDKKEEQKVTSTNKKNDDNKIKLEDCLNNFCNEECLAQGNEWECKKCKNRVTAQKKLELFYMPKILIICLTRFKRNRTYFDKNNTFINYPVNNFSLEKYVVGPDKYNSKYDLFGVIEHIGGTDGGHYKSICKNIDNKWYLYDDENVKNISTSDIVTQNGYILLYRRESS